MPKENVYGFTEDNKRVKIGEIGKIVTFPSDVNKMYVSSTISDYITFKINGGSSISSADFIQNYIGQSVTGIDTIEIISSQYPTRTSFIFNSDVSVTYNGLDWDDPSNAYNKSPFGPTTSTFTNVQFSYINIAINQSTSFSYFNVFKYEGPV